MRKTMWLPVLFLSLVVTVSGQATNEMSKKERTIRGMEQALVEAVLARDIQILETLFSDELIVSSPINTISKKPLVLQLFREKKISYSAFDVQIEEVLILSDSVIVTGKEIVKPIDNTPFTGTTVERRYSQVWRQNAGKWQLVFRHASVICPK